MHIRWGKIVKQTEKRLKITQIIRHRGLNSQYQSWPRLRLDRQWVTTVKILTSTKISLDENKLSRSRRHSVKIFFSFLKICVHLLRSLKTSFQYFGFVSHQLSKWSLPSPRLKITDSWSVDGVILLTLPWSSATMTSLLSAKTSISWTSGIRLILRVPVSWS